MTPLTWQGRRHWRLLASAAATFLLATGHVGALAAALPSMPPPTAADRVLVVSPHPDDETLCCGGFIQRAREAGAEVTIVWMTAGDAFELDALVVEHHLREAGRGLMRLGLQRMGEARAAGATLGVPESRLIVLGYPDRGLRALLAGNYSEPYRSRYTRSLTIPYATVLSPGASYEGRNLERDLAAVIDSVQPTLVLAAAPADLHSDHATSGELATRLMTARGNTAAMRYWIVHAGRHWPRPRGVNLELALEPPRLARDLAWEQFALAPTEREIKLQALRQHRSQMEVMGRFLEGFVRANELFAR